MAVTATLALISIPVALLTLCFALELFVGLRPLRRQVTKQATGSAVIIVPAHNEEAILTQSLAKLHEAVGSKVRILLVADNCTDLTAETARHIGVEVIERFDEERRGKGFALDFARRHLRTRPPDIVLIVDADCEMEGNSIERLIGACEASGRPVQGAYLQNAVRNRSPTMQISTFAFFIKNVIRQRALQRLAGRVHLAGTGMAFPWELFDRSGLASANIVEDLELGLELADAGFPANLIEDAEVWSDPAGSRETMDQRRRWEGGYLQSAGRWGPLLLAKGMRYGDARIIWAAFSLFIPPLAMLVGLDIAALVLAALGTMLAGAAIWPILLIGGSMAGAGLGIALAWVFGGSRFVSLLALAHIPIYLLWKLPLYIGLARRGAPKEWLKTGRG